MRITISIDDDLLDRVSEIAARLRRPFRTVADEPLRAGLHLVEQLAEQRPYKTEPHAMNLRPDRNLDNIHEFPAQIEGEDSR
jgi:hypothetical protein